LEPYFIEVTRQIGSPTAPQLLEWVPLTKRIGDEDIKEGTVVMAVCQLENWDSDKFRPHIVLWVVGDRITVIPGTSSEFDRTSKIRFNEGLEHFDSRQTDSDGFRYTTYFDPHEIYDVEVDFEIDFVLGPVNVESYQQLLNDPIVKKWYEHDLGQSTSFGEIGCLFEARIREDTSRKMYALLKKLDENQWLVIPGSTDPPRDDEYVTVPRGSSAFSETSTHSIGLVEDTHFFPKNSLVVDLSRNVEFLQYWYTLGVLEPEIVNHMLLTSGPQSFFASKDNVDVSNGDLIAWNKGGDVGRGLVIWANDGPANVRLLVLPASGEGSGKVMYFKPGNGLPLGMRVPIGEDLFVSVDQSTVFQKYRSVNPEELKRYGSFFSNLE
jgi:hypothetical protein